MGLWDGGRTILKSFASLMVAIGGTWVFFPALVAAWTHNEIKYSTKRLVKGMNDDSALLSIVIPAYNEETRIPLMLREAHDYLESSRGKKLLKKLQNHSTESLYSERSLSIEWVIVNDGSTDNTTASVAETWNSIGNPSQHPCSVLTLDCNQGKGAAVKTGMMAANGDFRLMVDADGATEFGVGLERVVEALISRNKDLNTKMIAVFGSRAHLQNASSTQRTLVRTILMYGFHFFVALLVSSRINDTQCGFKLFTRDSTEACFRKLHLRRWAFDTELVVLCDIQKIYVDEVGVPWHEVDGSKLATSKLALALVSLSMLRDMICVRACYSLGFWKA